MMAFGPQTTENGRASDSVDGVGLRPNSSSYEEAYGLELSRRILATGATLYQAKDASEIRRELQVTGSKLDLAPLALMVTATLVYR
jgi:hypothetical protein